MNLWQIKISNFFYMWSDLKTKYLTYICIQQNTFVIQLKYGSLHFLLLNVHLVHLDFVTHFINYHYCCFSLANAITLPSIFFPSITGKNVEPKKTKYKLISFKNLILFGIHTYTFSHVLHPLQSSIIQIHLFPLSISISWEISDNYHGLCLQESFDLRP